MVRASANATTSKPSALAAVSRLGGDALGGLVGAVMIVPIILSCGVVSFHTLGPEFVSAGIMAAFTSAILGTVIAGLLGGAPLHVSCPKTSHAAILSGLLAVVAAHQSFSDYYTGDEAPKALMMVSFITLILAGFMQLLIGALRLGNLVQFVPYPVLAGVINGFALQIILSQIPNALGVATQREVWLGLTGLLPINPWAVGFMLLSCLVVVMIGRWAKAIPSALGGLIVGTLAYILAGRYLDPAALGPVIGKLPASELFVPQVNDMLDFVHTDTFQLHLVPIVATAATLALISSIQSLLSIASADELFGTCHNGNRELLVQGAVNTASAAMGGTPNGGSPNITRSVHANGGRTHYANLVAGGALLAFSYGLGDVIAQIPLSVMAGVIIVSTATTADAWTRQLLRNIGTSSSLEKRRDVLINLGVVLVVTALVVAKGALVALGVGMAATIVIFLHRTKSQIIRRVWHLDQLSSRVVRPQSDVAGLLANSKRVAVMELHGPLFFGNSETVILHVHEQMTTADWIILNCRRCTMIDTSGAMALKRIDKAMDKAGKRLFLAYLPAGGRRREYLRHVGVGGIEASGRIFEDVDSALAVAENELLGQVMPTPELRLERQFADFEIAAGMAPSDIALIERRLERRSYKAGELIIQEGQADTSLYFLTSGVVSVFTNTEGRRLRLESYSSGVDAMFGEISLMTRAPGSADVVADTPVTVLCLSRQALEELNLDAPKVAMQLTQHMYEAVSSRLQRTTQLVRELES